MIAASSDDFPLPTGPAMIHREPFGTCRLISDRVGLSLDSCVQENVPSIISIAALPLPLRFAS